LSPDTSIQFRHRKFQMNTLLKVGTVFVQEGAVLPSEVPLETESFSRSWKAVSNLDGFAMGRKIEDAKWRFFYLAGQRSATAMGNEGQPAISKAVVRIMGRLPRETYNSLEVTQIVSKRFLGIPYVQVFAHARHVQEEMQLVAPGERSAPGARTMKPARPPAVTVTPATVIAGHS
jgi:hypothetical protein